MGSPRGDPVSDVCFYCLHPVDQFADCACPARTTPSPDRRDRDELTDRDDLTQVIHNVVCVAGVHCRKPRDIHYNTEDPQRIAEAILAAGWIHWPHECAPEAEKNEKWQRSVGYDTGYAAGYEAAARRRP